MIKSILLLVFVIIASASLISAQSKECSWWLSYEAPFGTHTGTFEDPFARLSYAINAVFNSDACPVEFDNTISRNIYMITSDTGVYKDVGNRDININYPASVTFTINVIPVDKGAPETYPMTQSTKMAVIDGENKGNLMMISELWATINFRGIQWQNGAYKPSSSYTSSIIVAGQTSSVNFYGCSFVNNRGGKTGTIYFITTSDSVFSGCQFRGNSATNGGALYFPSGFSKVSVLDSVFTANNANANGGSIFTTAYFLLIKNTKFIDGTAGNKDTNTPGRGGAIYVDRSPRFADLVWDQLSFVNNHADDGGALYDHMASIEYTNALFSKNVANQNGGAAYFDTSTSVFSHSNFTENSALNGGAVWTFDRTTKVAQLLIKLSTFTLNKAETGGAMYCNASTSNLNTLNNYSMNYASSKENTTVDFCTSTCLTASAVCGCYSGCGIPPVPPKVITDTRETKIAIGIFLPVTAVLLGVVIFLLWKTNEKAKQKKANLNYDEIKLTIPDNSNDPL